MLNRSGRPRLFMLMACLAPMLGSPSAQAQSQSDLVAPSTPIQTGTSFELDSAVLGDVRQVNVWLPTGYAESTDRYSVVYLLDGALDQDFHHIAGLAPLGSLSWLSRTEGRRLGNECVRTCITWGAAVH